MNDPLTHDVNEKFTHGFGVPDGMFSYSDIEIVVLWCKENIKGRWGFRKWSVLPFIFEDHHDATLFKMFWNPKPTESYIDKDHFVIKIVK